MAKDLDWYPNSRPKQRAMYANIELKIDGYAAKYPFLSPNYRAQIHLACQAFIAGYDALVANRATAKQETGWFENLLTGTPQGELAPAGPTYQPSTLPAGAFIGIEPFICDFAGLFKEQLNYDDEDGRLSAKEHPRRPVVTDLFGHSWLVRRNGCQFYINADRDGRLSGAGG